LGNLERRLERLERDLEATEQGEIPQAVMNEAFSFLSDEELEAVGEAVMRPDSKRHKY
jgi:cytochrome c553